MSGTQAATSWNTSHWANRLTGKTRACTVDGVAARFRAASFQALAETSVMVSSPGN
ncbi:TPA: hypothetical protein ON570_004936 [Citrobacter werkmanii]|nr:hypothetical protein [Citrobacter werkmanii]